MRFSTTRSADIEILCKQDGIKEHAATLLKLTDWIRTYYAREDVTQIQTEHLKSQLPLFPEIAPDTIQADPKTPDKKNSSAPAKSGLFGKAMLQKAIDMLPQLPDEELDVAVLGTYMGVPKEGSSAGITIATGTACDNYQKYS